MPKVTDITVLNIDDKPYAVESLPDEVKALVEIYNDWNRKEAEVRDELVRFQAAKETLSRQIIGKVREHITAEEPDKDAVEPTPEGESVPHVSEVTDPTDVGDSVPVTETVQ